MLLFKFTENIFPSLEYAAVHRAHCTHILNQNEREMMYIFYLRVLCINNEEHRFTGENGFSIGHRPYLHNKLPVVSIYYAIVDYSSQNLVALVRPMSTKT